MLAGQLRHRFSFKQPGETGGDAAITEPTVFTAYGELLSQGGSQAGMIVQGEYRIRIRYRTGVNPRMVIYDSDGRKFQITSIADPDGRRRELLVTATELQ